MKHKVLGIAILFIFLFFAAGCNLQRLETGPTQTKSESVELGAAESVEAEIKLAAGTLQVNGGSDDLLTANFSYNVEEWEPEVDYTVTGSEGNLTVEQPSVPNQIPYVTDKMENDWDLQLNSGVPMDLAITIAAGEGQLDLGSLQLDRFTFEGGAGEVSIDLGGSNARDLDIRLGAGQVTLDLSGDWQADLNGSIQGGVGELTIYLPESVGVRVEVDGGLGSVVATGMSKNGDIFTNDAYGTSPVELDLAIQGGIGEINLEVVSG